MFRATAPIYFKGFITFFFLQIVTRSVSNIHPPNTKIINRKPYGTHVEIIPVQYIADRTVTIGGDVWKKGSFKRGDMIDDALGNNLGHSFAKIDKLENGVAVSIKSIKLSDKTYETAKGIYNKLRRDVDVLDDFTIGTRKGIDVTLEDYSSKKLEIAIPDMKITAEQQRGLEMVKEYAKEKGIEITITVVK
ncbi:hypothetical protein [uncultured Selenomonas sp.]|uniref:endonuclease toxin domain-containing protein n=1 Tax=uncultured Selenomonas sp. TaxID=159275 RepID=UPI0028DC6573|nr:hypothetical protein [uncultured Selenomonas sp.]